MSNACFVVLSIEDKYARFCTAMSRSMGWKCSPPASCGYLNASGMYVGGPAPVPIDVLPDIVGIGVSLLLPLHSDKLKFGFFS